MRRFAAIALLVLAGCATPKVSSMRPAASACKACSQDAVVVFVRPAHESPLAVELREEDGTFLGSLENRTWFAAPVAPGRHLFIASAVTDASTVPTGLRADLEPGMVYHVEVRMLRSYPALFAASPKRRLWDNLDAAFARLTRLERVPASEPAAPQRWPRSVGTVKAWWVDLGEQDWAERTLFPADGVPPSAALVELGAAGVACAPKPLEFHVVSGDKASEKAGDKSVPVCWKEAEIGSHQQKLVCMTKEEQDEKRDESQDFFRRRMHPVEANPVK